MRTRKPWISQLEFCLGLLIFSFSLSSPRANSRLLILEFIFLELRASTHSSASHLFLEEALVHLRLTSFFGFPVL